MPNHQNNKLLRRRGRHHVHRAFRGNADIFILPKQTDLLMALLLSIVLLGPTTQRKVGALMDAIRAFYDMKFSVEYYKSTGDTFQEFFEKIMGLAHKADFMACRPWGRIGDKKNDGFLKSQKHLFQCYAPNEMKETDCVKKINEDFAGALKHWKTLFTKWSFVHNCDAGLPPHVHEVILKHEQDHKDKKLKIGTWGEFEIRDEFRKISLEDLASWLGPVPGIGDRLELGFSEIQVVLEAIADRTPAEDAQVKVVPAGKLDANSLDDSTKQVIREGMVKTPLVEAFFRQWHDPNFGENTAQKFRTKYKKLKDKGVTPNHIFIEFVTWVGGSGYVSPSHQLAVYTVIAYFFERCDIFEEPRSHTS